MINFAKNITRWFIVILACVAVLSCLSGNSPFPEEDNEPVLDGKSYSITVQLIDPDTGEETRTISFGYPGLLKITVKESNGVPAGNILITASTTKGSFAGSSDGTSMTNPSGIAQMTLQAELDSGAGEISIKIGEYSWEDTFTFLIGTPADVKLGSFDGGVFTEGVLFSSIASDEILAIGANATIKASLAILNGSVYEPFDTTTPVSFSTNCSGASTSDPKYEGNGTTSVIYSAGDCSATSDTITASVEIFGTNLSASGEINLATPELGSIEFISAVPTHIALQGTATPDRPSTSVVSFKVKDDTGIPLTGVEVNFHLSTTKGGLEISSPSSVTNSEGIATVIVTSGSIPTSVTVSCTIDLETTTLYAQSVNLVVSTGLPDQNSFSISAETVNPEAWNYDGVTLKVTVNAADHFNNPVPDSTAIYFTTEGGRIEPSCTTENGSCWVTWTSQDPRPDGISVGFGEDRAARVTILATAIGEESFEDNNGNGRFDSGIDGHTANDDLREAFLDLNENGLHESGEEFSDFDQNGNFSQANGKYNGTLCNDDGCSKDLVDVRDSMVIVMSSRDAGDFYFRPLPDGDPSDDLVFAAGSSVADVEIYLEDENGNAMPKGSKVTIIPPDNADIYGSTEFEILDTTEPLTRTITLQKKTVEEPEIPGLLGAWVETPGGTITYASSIQVFITP